MVGATIRPMSKVGYLLYPEWQGYGVDASPYHGALDVARAVFPDAVFTRVESPVEEALTIDEGVLGLSSISSRFRATLADLRVSHPDRVVTVGLRVIRRGVPSADPWSPLDVQGQTRRRQQPR